MSDVQKLATWVPVTDEALVDAPVIHEALAVHVVGTKPTHRYATVWRQGYWAALNDIRSGRLVLRDGMFDVGPNGFKQAA